MMACFGRDSSTSRVCWRCKSWSHGSYGSGSWWGIHHQISDGTCQKWIKHSVYCIFMWGFIWSSFCLSFMFRGVLQVHDHNQFASWSPENDKSWSSTLLYQPEIPSKWLEKSPLWMLPIWCKAMNGCPVGYARGPRPRPLGSIANGVPSRRRASLRWELRIDPRVKTLRPEIVDGHRTWNQWNPTK